MPRGGTLQVPPPPPSNTLRSLISSMMCMFRHVCEQIRARGRTPIALAGLGDAFRAYSSPPSQRRLPAACPSSRGCTSAAPRIRKPHCRPLSSLCSVESDGLLPSTFCGFAFVLMCALRGHRVAYVDVCSVCVCFHRARVPPPLPLQVPAGAQISDAQGIEHEAGAFCRRSQRKPWWWCGNQVVQCRGYSRNAPRDGGERDQVASAEGGLSRSMLVEVWPNRANLEAQI